MNVRTWLSFLRVSLRKDEGLAAVGGPHIVELPRVPDDLEEEEGETDGVRGRARTTHEQVTVTGNGTSGPGNMALQRRRGSG